MPSLITLSATDWKDYELLDSGNGMRLERFGRYTLIRPEYQAVWRPRKPKPVWDDADAIFHPTAEESGGHWAYRRHIDTAWKMQYKSLSFYARTSASRHLGFFPEQAVHWDWITEQISFARQPVNVLNLFGYTGLASLAAAQAGAKVTHVDASKKTVAQARENQRLSGLPETSIRWIVDDALKFVKREKRRNVIYDGLILDPPKFGRGPKGEVWEFFQALPVLMKECHTLLGNKPLFVIMTAYAIRASALSLYFSIDEMMQTYAGSIEAGELVLQERNGGRALSMAIFARWQSDNIKKSDSLSKTGRLRSEFE